MNFMNTISKILFIFLFFVSSITMYAQRSKRRLNTDFKIGVNFTQFDIEGGNMFKVPKLGLHIGGNVSYKFLYDFQVQSGFFISKKGLRQHEKSYSVDPNTDLVSSKDNLFVIDANYIHVPLNLGFERYFTNTFAVNVNAGAYFAYGISGKTRRRTFEVTAGSDPVVTDSGEIETFDIRGLNRIDYGLGGSIGLVQDIYTLTLNYEYGLNDISNLQSRVYKNRNISISLGFRF